MQREKAHADLSDERGRDSAGGSIGAGVLRFFLLFTPEDSSAEFVAPSAVDVFVQCDGFFQIVGFVGETIIITIIQCNPDVVIVVASMLAVFGGV